MGELGILIPVPLLDGEVDGPGGIMIFAPKDGGLPPLFGCAAFGLAGNFTGVLGTG